MIYPEEGGERLDDNYDVDSSINEVTHIEAGVIVQAQQCTNNTVVTAAPFF